MTLRSRGASSQRNTGFTAALTITNAGRPASARWRADRTRGRGGPGRVPRAAPLPALLAAAALARGCLRRQRPFNA
jgi:hypothetical protein